MSALIGGLLGLVRETVETKNKARLDALQVERERIHAQIAQAQIQAIAQIRSAQIAADAEKGKSK